jgi:hypothetical protein
MVKKGRDIPEKANNPAQLDGVVSQGKPIIFRINYGER